MTEEGDERARLVQARRAVLASRLRQLRAARRWTQETVARKAGINRAHYSQIELGNHAPSLDTVWDLAAAFGVPITDLLREPS